MNLNERLELTTEQRDPSKISTQDKPSFSSNVSPNSSSQPSEQPSILRSIQELTAERDQARRDLQDKDEELQEMKQLNSTLSWQNSKLKQMLAGQEQNSRFEKQILLSQIARMTDEMSMQKHQTRQLETMYLNALRENDDLRNECGILTRKQVNEVLAENARLKEEIDANRY